MKASGVLAVLLSVSLPGGAFAQNISAASRAGASAEAGVTGAIGTIQTAPALIGGMPSLTLSPASLTPGLLPLPSLALAPSIAPAAAPPSAHAAVLAVAAASAEPVKPIAFSAIPAAPAVAKSEAAAAKTWTEKIAAMFDGSAKKDAGDLDPADLKAFVVNHGKPRVEITMTEAAARGGQVRLLTAKNDPKGLNEKHAARVSALLSPAVKLQQEQLTVDWSPKKTAEAAAAASAAAPAGLIGKLTWPFREAKFLAKAFGASLVKPVPSEILGGFATKTFPLVTSIGVYWAAVGLAHPLALAGLIGLSVAQEVFHGFFLKSWNNFQEELRRARGFNYQMFFNLAYMQGFGTLYRLLSWSANPASVTPPWSVHYWKDIAVMSVVGTFFGVLGYNSLNTLYAKGAIKRWQHSGIQQLRDLCFLLAGPFFASGSMTVFWSIFLFQQFLDLAIAIWAGRAHAKPIVILTSAAVAGSAEFEAKYPAGEVKIESPLKQAGRAVVDNPLVRLMTWPARALWKLVRGGPKT